MNRPKLLSIPVPYFDTSLSPWILQVWLSVSGIISTGLAIGVSFGLCSAFGFFYGPVHSVLPFLLLGIGVDDMFVIIEVWNNMTDDDHKNHSVPERLGICLSHAVSTICVFCYSAACNLPAMSLCLDSVCVMYAMMLL